MLNLARRLGGAALAALVVVSLSVGCESTQKQKKDPPPKKKQPIVTASPTTPKIAIAILRQSFGERNFSGIWLVLPNKARRAILKGADAQLEKAVKVAGMKTGKMNAKTKAYVKAVAAIVGGRSAEEMKKLSAREKTAAFYAYLDLKGRAASAAPPSGPYKILRRDTRIISTKIQKDEATVIVESQWLYRRKRSEVLLTREDGTWRYRSHKMNTVGKTALGKEALTISAEKQEKLFAIVRKAITTPPSHYRTSLLARAEVETIQELGPAAATVALGYLKDKKSPLAHKQGAMAVLRALGEESELLLPEAKKMIASSDSLTFEIGCAMASAMKRAGEGAVPDLLAAFRKGKPSDIMAAGRALVSLKRGAEILPELKKMLASEDGGVVQGACHVLGEMGPAAAGAVPELLAAFRKGKPNTVVMVGNAVVAVKQGSRLLPDLKKMLLAKDVTTVAVACRVAGTLGPDAAKLAPELVATLKHKKPGLSVTAALILASLQIEEKAALPVLVGAMVEFPSAHRQIVNAFGRYGDKAKGAVKPLAKLLTHKNPKVRSGTIQALLAIGKPSLAVVAELREAVNKEKDNYLRMVLAKRLKALEAKGKPKPKKDTKKDTKKPKSPHAR